MPQIPIFDVTSVNRLSSCDKRLWDLFNKVVETYDCFIICGARGQKEQDEAYPIFSKLKYPDSPHNKVPSLAVDACPKIAGKPMMNDREALVLLAGYVLATAGWMGIKIRWGGDWNRNRLTTDEKFSDLYHFELEV